MSRRASRGSNDRASGSGGSGGAPTSGSGRRGSRRGDRGDGDGARAVSRSDEKSLSASRRRSGSAESKRADAYDPKTQTCEVRMTLFNVGARSVDEATRILRATVSSDTTDLVVFPESFVTVLLDPDDKEDRPYRAAKASEKNTRMLLIGACVALGVDCLICGRDYTRRGVLNTAWYVDRRGNELHRYTKQKVVEHDARSGSDERFASITEENAPPNLFWVPCAARPDQAFAASVLICADLEDPRIVAAVNELAPSVVFNPARVGPATQSEGPVYRPIVEGSKQEVEALLEGRSTYGKTVKRAMREEREREGGADDRGEEEEEEEEEKEDDERKSEWEFAGGGAARSAYVVRTDYPFPVGLGSSMVLRPSPNAHNPSKTSPDRAEIEARRVAWQPTWDRVWVPTVRLRLPCRPLRDLVLERHGFDRRAAESELADEDDREADLDVAIAEAITSSGPPPAPPDFLVSAPPPAPDFEDYPLGPPPDAPRLDTPPPPPPSSSSPPALASSRPLSPRPSSSSSSSRGSNRKSGGGSRR